MSNVNYFGERCWHRNSSLDSYCNGCNITQEVLCPIGQYLAKSIKEKQISTRISENRTESVPEGLLHSGEGLEREIYDDDIYLENQGATD